MSFLFGWLQLIFRLISTKSSLVWRRDISKHLKVKCNNGGRRFSRSYTRFCERSRDISLFSETLTPRPSANFVNSFGAGQIKRGALGSVLIYAVIYIWIRDRVIYSLITRTDKTEEERAKITSPSTSRKSILRRFSKFRRVLSFRTRGDLHRGADGLSWSHGMKSESLSRILYGPSRALLLALRPHPALIKSTIDTVIRVWNYDITQFDILCITVADLLFSSGASKLGSMIIAGVFCLSFIGKSQATSIVNTWATSNF